MSFFSCFSNTQYFSKRGCANDTATSLREAALTTPLSTSQYKCPCPILLYERLRQRRRSVQVPHDK
ncbi:MAG: hypothetical protein ACYTXA_08815 [Nostoc sp.]